MPIISIIVPVYKVEQYLSACVDSILAQTFTDFELILVDDGSPDNCGAMCDAYAEQDPRIKVIHQQNGGLSAARNSGIDAAIGQYITFIDSDDYVSSCYLEALYQAVAHTGSELSVCRTKTFLDGQKPRNVDRRDGTVRTISGKDAVIAIYHGDEHVPVNAWGKLYQRALIGGMRFPAGKLHEDQAFVPIACYNAVQIACVDAGLYFYRERQDSITTRAFSLKRYDDIWAIDQCIAYFEEKGESEIVSAARDKRKRVLCSYAILAKAEHIVPPEEYDISKGKALRYLKKHVSEEKYAYFFAQAHPKLVRPNEYWRRMKRLFLKQL